MDHTSIYRGVARFTPLFIDAARPCRRVPGNRWQVDETYCEGRRGCGTTCTALSTSSARSSTSTRASVRTGRRPAGSSERPWPPAWRRWRSSTDRAPVYPRLLDELAPAARHVADRYGNNRVEADHGRLKARLHPMRGLKRDRSLRIIAAGHAFIQNLRRGHYGLAVDQPARDKVPAGFTELTRAI